MEYKYLKEDGQAQMLAQRMAQYEQEHYNHTINLQLLKATGATDPQTVQGIADAEAAMAVLEEAHAACAVECEKVEAAVEARKAEAQKLVADNAAVDASK